MDRLNFRDADGCSPFAPGEGGLCAAMARSGPCVAAGRIVSDIACYFRPI
jgi:hypothetical protein